MFVAHLDGDELTWPYGHGSMDCMKSGIPFGMGEGWEAADAP
jgi:hypothetical protein